MSDTLKCSQFIFAGNTAEARNALVMNGWKAKLWSLLVLTQELERKRLKFSVKKVVDFYEQYYNDIKESKS